MGAKAYNLSSFDPIINLYTRKQAIKDGVLVDVSLAAKEAGIKHPVAVTRSVWEKYQSPVAYGIFFIYSAG